MNSRSLPVTVPVDERPTIMEHRTVAPDHRHMRVRAPRIAALAEPGHFVQVRVSDRHEPLLRRPMSIALADTTHGTIDLLYRVAGAGTTVLSTHKVGDDLSIMGPLGHGFEIPDDGTVALVGGGVGMPPLHFIASRTESSRVVVVQGARTADLLLYRDEFARLGAETMIATDDGTAGTEGQVPRPLRELLEVGGADSILSCGPTPMLAAVAKLAREFGVPCQVSLEEHMACGIGICMGCAVRDVGGSSPTYSLVCTDGPVFDAQKVFAAE